MTQVIPTQFSQVETAQFPRRPLHLAIGMFDGVHLGHQAVLETAVQSANASNGVSGALTFWPHPSRLFSPAKPVKMIMSPEIKVNVLASHHIEYIVQQPFNESFAAIAAEDLVKYLKKYMPTLSSLHVGSNWRFGKGRIGDIPMLVELGRKNNVHVISVPRVFYDGKPISSTRIRKHLLAGEIEKANALLGDVYFSIASVVEGKKLGSKVGFPTLNLPWSPELNPPYGVYCVEAVGVKDGNKHCLKGVANFGVRPTVETTDKPVLEVHALEECPFSAGDTLKVRWFHFLRSEKKFESVGELTKQISLDVQHARKYWKL